MFRELSPTETFEELSAKDNAVLIDCRAPGEWHFTGTPDLSGIGKRVVLAAIVDEAGRPNPDFIAEVKAVATPDMPVYFICRVGGRSANACRMLANEGFGDLVNVLEGLKVGQMRMVIATLWKAGNTTIYPGHRADPARHRMDPIQE